MSCLPKEEGGEGEESVFTVTTTLPRLFVVELPADLVQTASTGSAFRRPWFLQLESNDKEDAKNDNIPRTRDVIFLPQCLTGAGELEGLRFVGSAVTKEDNNAIRLRLPLLRADIEQVVFPQSLFHETEAKTLRSCYEPLVNNVLRRQGGLTLSDLYGGDDVVEEFWAAPDVRPDLADNSQEALLIPWKDCRVERVVSQHTSS